MNDDGQIGNEKAGSDQVQAIPFKINDVIEDKVVGGSLGDHHSVLLTKKENNVITFGRNKVHQCSSLCDAKRILKPHIVLKGVEIGTLETSYVEKVLAINNTTLVFIDPSRSVL